MEMSSPRCDSHFRNTKNIQQQNDQSALENSAAFLPEKEYRKLQSILMELAAPFAAKKSAVHYCPVQIVQGLRLKTKPNISNPVTKGRDSKNSNAALVLLLPNQKVLIQKQSTQARWGGLWTISLLG